MDAQHHTAPATGTASPSPVAPPPPPPRPRDGDLAFDDGRGWLEEQFRDIVWLPVAIGLAVGVLGLVIQTVAALSCTAEPAYRCATAADGAGGLGFLTVPGGALVSLVLTSYRPRWPELRRHGVVRLLRGIVAAAALVGAGLAAIVGLLFACTGEFLCGNDPAAAAGMFSLAGAALGVAAWVITARGRWWLHMLLGAAIGALPGALV